MSTSLSADVAGKIAHLFHIKPNAPTLKHAARPSYRLVKDKVSDPVTLKNAIDWLELAEKGGNTGKNNATQALKLLQRLSWSDAGPAIKLLEMAKNSQNETMRTFATEMHAQLSAENPKPAQDVAREITPAGPSGR